MKRAIVLGTLAALFFASTFVVNRLMTLGGASVYWLASLRYVFTAPILAIVLVAQGTFKATWHAFTSRPWPWVIWGSIGFGLFYLPLTWASHWAPAWLVAGSWQLTIIMGSLAVPFIATHPGQNAIPWRDLWPSAIILGGVALTEWISHASLGSDEFKALVPILLAAIAYPVGNRQMMHYTQTQLPRFSVYQRTFAMTLGSMPFWIVTMAYGGWKTGWPGGHVVLASAAVAIASGVIATLLFFRATDEAKGRSQWLARIEATQSLEIVFTVLLASLLFGQPWPKAWQTVGLAVILVGLVLHSMRRPADRAKPIVLHSQNNLAE